MTTFHCDKLCSCDTCAPIRWALSYVESVGKPLGSYAAVCHRDSAERLAAWFASRDPAKLAELTLLAMVARGWHSFDDPGEYMELPCVHVVSDVVDSTPYVGIRLWWWEDLDKHVRRSLEMTFAIHKARAKLLAIMQTSPDESSRDACERILRGEP